MDTTESEYVRVTPSHRGRPVVYLQVVLVHIPECRRGRHLPKVEEQGLTAVSRVDRHKAAAADARGWPTMATASDDVPPPSPLAGSAHGTA